jgi:four helix bundle protein
MTTHHQLEVWKQSITFVTAIYQVTGRYPKTEQFSLIDQMRRAAISIPSNIAEGAGRSTPSQYRYFLNVALGSLAEIETQLIISNNLNYNNSNEFEVLNKQRTNVARLLQALLKSINRKTDP